MLLVYDGDCYDEVLYYLGIMEMIGLQSEKKCGKYGPPETLLAVGIKKFNVDIKALCSMNSDQYINNEVKTVRDLIEKYGRYLPSGKQKHLDKLSSSYKPELDTTCE